MPQWNPWHGCTKVSPGCAHCYVYRRDAEVGRDASFVSQTGQFGLPLKKDRKKQYKLKPEDGTVYTCFTSDFFHPAADVWRPQAWAMMRERSDLTFFFITKRPQRFYAGLPEDWGDGYENVHIGCTCEDQARADERLPVFLSLPIRHRHIIHEPMLGPVKIKGWLTAFPGAVEEVSCGGESGPGARMLDYAWVLDVMLQCVEANVSFSFHQTGAVFKRGERVWQIDRKDQQSQAKKAGIDFTALPPGAV